LLVVALAKHKLPGNAFKAALAGFFCNGNNKPLGYLGAFCYLGAFFLLLRRLLPATATPSSCYRLIVLVTANAFFG